MLRTNETITIGNKKFKVTYKQGASRKTYFVIFSNGHKVIVSKKDFN